MKAFEEHMKREAMCDEPRVERKPATYPYIITGGKEGLEQ